MPDKAYRDTVPVVLFICAISMVLAAFFISIVLLIENKAETLKNREVGKVNQTYTRATNCFAAESPSLRTPEYTQECYKKAEAATGVKVEHYGTASR